MRYLHEMFTYARHRRLALSGYGLEEVPALVLEAATAVTSLTLDRSSARTGVRVHHICTFLLVCASTA